MWEWVLPVLVIAAPVGWVVYRGAVYRRLFADEHFLEVARGVARLKAAALDKVLASEEDEVLTPADPRGLVTSAGLILFYTVDRVEDRFVHHYSVSYKGGYTAHAVGEIFVLFVARLLGVPPAAFSLGVGQSTIHHAIFQLAFAEQSEFAGRVVPEVSPEEVDAFHVESIEARKHLLWKPLEESGVQCSEAIAWNPAKGENPDDHAAEGAFRAQHCLFAFEIVPESLRGSAASWREADEGERVHELLIRLWNDAGTRAESLGEFGKVPSAGLSAELAGVGGSRFLVVTLPPPVAAPEPYFLAVPINAIKGTPSQVRIFTAESVDNFSAPPVVGAIDEESSHAILGEAFGPSRDDFLQTLEAVASGGPLPLPECRDSILRQLQYYAQIIHLGGRARWPKARRWWASVLRMIRQWPRLSGNHRGVS